MPKPSEIVPIEWLHFLEDMYQWKELPKEQRLQILVEANLSYLEFEDLCRVINDLLAPEVETTETFKDFLKQLGDIICVYDPISNYFWEIKTKHDFSPFKNVQEAFPTDSEDWKGEYEHFLKMLEKNLIEAVRVKDLDAVVHLLELGVDLSAKNNIAIRWASRSGYTEIVRILLEDEKVDPSAINNSAILSASRDGHIEIVRMLLEDERVDPSAHDNQALRLASMNGHAEVVKVLLADPRVDPSAIDNYAIRWASENGNEEVVRILLADERVDPSAKNNSALVWASRGGHAEVVRILLADPRVDATELDL